MNYKYLLFVDSQTWSAAERVRLHVPFLRSSSAYMQAIELKTYFLNSMELAQHKFDFKSIETLENQSFIEICKTLYSFLNWWGENYCKFVYTTQSCSKLNSYAVVSHEP